MVTASPMIGCRVSVTTSPVDLVTRTSMFFFRRSWPLPPLKVMVRSCLNREGNPGVTWNATSLPGGNVCVGPGVSETGVVVASVPSTVPGIPVVGDPSPFSEPTQAAENASASRSTTRADSNLIFIDHPCTPGYFFLSTYL